MKAIIFYLFLLSAVSAGAQKFYTSSGTITFISEAPAEKIFSENKQVTSMLNINTKDIAFKVLMKSFQFDKQGMYDHFNSKYLETGKFPNATFEGKITDAADLAKNGTYPVTVSGTLTIHGVSQPVKQKGTIIVTDGKISLRSDFTILLSDFGVKVSADYIKRISNTVQVKVDAVLSPYNR